MDVMETPARLPSDGFARRFAFVYFRTSGL